MSKACCQFWGVSTSVWLCWLRCEPSRDGERGGLFGGRGQKRRTEMTLAGRRKLCHLKKPLEVVLSVVMEERWPFQKPGWWIRSHGLFSSVWLSRPNPAEGGVSGSVLPPERSSSSPSSSPRLPVDVLPVCSHCFNLFTSKMVTLFCLRFYLMVKVLEKEDLSWAYKDHTRHSEWLVFAN